ncbi:MAG: hypothetical protein QNJ46_23225 [Leptolyngbyaceae cyanobacterium MO_188.B28]|nr:hypothetical protein [Leptolyngbyaceae cyanobacterium MO_188.B28]
MKYISLLWILTLVLLLSWGKPAEAAFCRIVNDHKICIVSIKRSAKNYWEYRASVSIDAVVTPIEIYDCRQRIRIKKGGAVIPFEPNGPGELICNLLYKSTG